ncbi:MAG: histidine--tRNA ligase [Armatimonadota bacterium]
MRYQVPKGTRDILPDDAREWQFAEERFREVCRRFGYQEIRTPVFEQTDLFVRSVGADTDIVRKEMYTFEDRGGRSLTLRAEGTAPAVRAYIEHNLAGQSGRLVKLYYIGPIFRYDRPQKGRYRQHHQAGMEAIGSSDPALDAEIIELALAWWAELGVTGCRVMVNSVGCEKCWPGYQEKLTAAVGEVLPQLCGDCQRRYQTNIRRILDCKQEQCRQVTDSAPRHVDHLCGECAEHFEGVKSCLEAVGIEYEVNPRIVRGLDYYTKTAFEVSHASLGAQDVLGGGGRYDGLVEACGGKPTPGVGAGLGIDRALMVRADLGLSVAADDRRCFLAVLGEEAKCRAVALLAELRRAGVAADMDHSGGSLKAQLRRADSGGYGYVAILGEDELAQGTVALRCMNTGEQRQVLQADLARELAG